MTRANRLRNISAAGALAVALATFGCAPTANLPPGVAPEPMPKGADWQGVYQGPYHIYLKITRAGDHAQGQWRAMGGREGELWGDLDGNVMKFSWSEHDVGSKASWSGRGYFVYRVREPGDAPEISGGWGLGVSDPKGTWYAVKRPEVSLGEAEEKLADGNSSGPADDNVSGSGCMGAACVGDDRELNDSSGPD